MNIWNAAVGEALTPLVKPPITQEQLRLYAEASGDYNPIHLDEEAARRVGLDGVIAHGMLSMAFLGQFAGQFIAETPEAYIAQLRVRFSGMVRLGDTLTCLGSVKDNDESGEQKTVTIECWAQNQKGEKVTGGEAVLVMPLSHERGNA